MKTISLEQFKGIVRARIDQSSSLRAVARSLGLSAGNISTLLLHAHRRPGPKLLRALGYRAITVYTKAK